MNDENKKRFEYLKSMYRAAPLSDADFEELKRLAKRYSKAMYEYLTTDELAR